MPSYERIIAFIFFIKLVINVVPLVAFIPAPLTSIRVDTGFPDVNYGEFEFGTRVPGERHLSTQNVDVNPVPIRGGTHHLTVIIDSPRREIITRVELRSKLGTRSVGEVVDFLGYGPNCESVKLFFVSKRDHGVHFNVKLFGR